jgi:uridine kinase
MNYNINFYYISMQILAHITGPTGSGKTTIWEILQIKYPHLKIIELDNVYRQVLKKYNLEKDELNNIKKKILLELQKLINNDIVITGNNVISSKKDFSDAIYYKDDLNVI